MQVKIQEALKSMGYDLRRPCRGHLMIRIGVIKVKHYAFRYRVGDGHVITRRGRVQWAERVNKNPDVYVFHVGTPPQRED